MVVTRQQRPKPQWAPCGRRETTQDYYLVRDGCRDFADYWEPRRDPDGVVRDRTSDHERQRWVLDNKNLIDKLNDIPAGSVLDVGCGPGWLLAELRAAQKFGVEPCESAAEAATRHADIVWSSLADVDVRPQLVVMNHVIEHMPDPIGAVNAVRRLLDKGGWLVIGTPDFGSPCALRFGENFRLLHDKTHISLFTLESCCRMMRDCGFEIRLVDFPFPDRYATPENFARWNDTSRVSPPWPGNVFTLWCQRA